MSPLYSAQMTYLQLLTETRSRINACQYDGVGSCSKVSKYRAAYPNGTSVSHRL